MYLRRFLLAIFVFGMLGTTGELLLLGHFEDAPQYIPLVILGLGFVVTGWEVWRPSATSTRAVQLILLLFVASGLVGLILHYRGNVEFERERDAALTGFALFGEAITGATPALAPGAMILLAMIGYAALVARRARPTGA